MCAIFEKSSTAKFPVCYYALKISSAVSSCLLKLYNSWKINKKINVYIFVSFQSMTEIMFLFPVIDFVAHLHGHSSIMNNGFFFK